ncbi:MAG: TraB/GumN family protein [Rubrivivax sp.]|nr:TraB/GumN family protein [Rubrivivax sp.]
MSRLARCAALLRALAVAAGLLGAAAQAQTTAAACPPPLPAAGGPAVDRGLLWRLTRDGRSSWLYGTLHVGRPAWQRAGPKLAAALRASDVLALELDPGDPAVAEALASLPHGPPLPEALQQRLQRAYDRACLAPVALAALHPVMQATTLLLLEARWLGLDPAYAQETLLAARARAAGKRIVALESAAQQQAVLVPADPDEARELVGQTLQQLEDASGRRVLQRLAEAWERGDLAALEDYGRWCECADSEAEREFLRRLNDERNGPLADGIAALHARGQRVFAAVGALHMTGPQALPALLAARGFRVERVEFGR